jgi:hypothetical protein
MSNPKKVKAISDLFAAIAKLGLNFAENQIEKKIANDLAQRGALLFLQPTRDIVVALNDQDEKNTAQVKAIILDWVNDNLSEYLEELSAVGIDKIKDSTGKAVLHFASKVVIDILILMSDDEKENDKQIEQYFQDLLSSGELRNLILASLLPALLAKAKAGEAVADVILKAAEIALDTIAKKD